MPDDPKYIEAAPLAPVGEDVDLEEEAREALDELVEDLREQLANTKVGDLDGDTTVLDIVEKELGDLVGNEKLQKALAAQLNAAIDDPVGVVPESWEGRAFEWMVTQVADQLQRAYQYLFSKVRG